MYRIPELRPAETYYAEGAIWDAGVELAYKANAVHSSILVYEGLARAARQRIEENPDSKHANSNLENADRALDRLRGDFRMLSYAVGLHIGPEGLVPRPVPSFDSEQVDVVAHDEVDIQKGYYFIGDEPTPIRG